MIDIKRYPIEYKTIRAVMLMCFLIQQPGNEQTKNED
jgi:hypothetical protein